MGIYLAYYGGVVYFWIGLMVCLRGYADMVSPADYIARRKRQGRLGLYQPIVGVRLPTHAAA